MRVPFSKYFFIDFSMNFKSEMWSGPNNIHRPLKMLGHKGVRCFKVTSYFFSLSLFFYTQMNTAITTDSNTPPRTPSRHYFYRKASLPSNTNANNNNNNNTNNGYTPTTPPITLLNDTESTNAFESKLEAFIKKQSVKTSVDNIFKEAANDLARRKADRRARKEKEEQQRNGEKQSAVNEKLATELIEQQQQSQEPLFEKLSILTPSEKSAWLSNIHDEAMLLNPHQWLKLASLFNVNSKATRQQTLLKDIPYLPEVLDDRSITVEQVRPLENYLELRDIQNRNYARDS